MEMKSKPVPMDLSSVAEAHDHATFVEWSDSGCPDWVGEEWWWQDDASEQSTILASIQEAEARHAEELSALRQGKGGKSKGKGKGKKGKGKTGKGLDGGKNTSARTAANSATTSAAAISSAPRRVSSPRSPGPIPMQVMLS